MTVASDTPVCPPGKVYEEEAQLERYLSHKRIMVVDDEPDLLLFIECVLNKHGYAVMKARNGHEALEKLQCFHARYGVLPNMVLMDIMMPKMKGDAACKMIKQDEHLKRIPVYLFSAKPDFEMEDVVQQSEADGFISKTTNYDSLCDKIRGITMGVPSSNQ